MPILSRYLNSMRKEELEELCERASLTIPKKAKVADLVRLLFIYAQTHPNEYEATLGIISPKSPFNITEELVYPSTAKEAVQEEEQSKIEIKQKVTGKKNQPSFKTNKKTTIIKNKSKPEPSSSHQEIKQNMIGLREMCQQQQTFLVQQQHIIQQQTQQMAQLQLEMIGGLTNSISQLRISHADESQEKRSLWEKFLSRVVSLNKTWNGIDRNRLEALTFLKAFEDLREQYEPNEKITFAGLRDSLPGAAKEWFMAYKNTFESYENFKAEFLKEFLPADYEMVLRGQIRNETQKEYERLSSFQARLRTMNSYLQSPLSEEDILEQLLLKSHKRYKLQFNLLEHKTISNLTRIAAAIENSTEFIEKPGSSRAENTNRRLNRPEETLRSCLNCHRPGHHFTQCELPVVVRCYYCGQKGKTINSCGCRKKSVASMQLNFKDESPKLLMEDTPVKECWKPEN